MTLTEWLCPDCGGYHVPALGGIRVGHPCPRTEPEAGETRPPSPVGIFVEAVRQKLPSLALAIEGNDQARAIAKGIEALIDKLDRDAAAVPEAGALEVKVPASLLRSLLSATCKWWQHAASRYMDGGGIEWAGEACAGETWAQGSRLLRKAEVRALSSPSGDARPPTPIQIDKAALNGSPEVRAECDARRAKGERCHSNRDGECEDKRCPQLRDGEPKKTGRHCPLDRSEDYDD